MKKIIITIVLLVIGLIIASKIRDIIKNTPPKQNNGAICTADAMMCLDGSYVGRSGAMCEFVCPPFSTTTSIGLNEISNIGSTTIKVISVLEDSRCPSDVQCIQAGRVRLSLAISSPIGTSNVDIESGKTINTGSFSITLDSIYPYPISTHKITPDEYSFTFIIKGK